MAQQIGEEVIDSFPTIENLGEFELENGQNVDWLLKNGDDLMYLEAKYSLSEKVGPLTRLAGQITGALEEDNGQVVVWSLKEPTQQALMALQTQIGQEAFKRVVFVNGVRPLFEYIGKYFGV